MNFVCPFKGFVLQTCVGGPSACLLIICRLTGAHRCTPSHQRWWSRMCLPSVQSLNGPLNIDLLPV